MDNNDNYPLGKIAHVGPFLSFVIQYSFFMII